MRMSPHMITSNLLFVLPDVGHNINNSLYFITFFFVPNIL